MWSPVEEPDVIVVGAEERHRVPHGGDLWEPPQSVTVECDVAVWRCCVPLPTRMLGSGGSLGETRWARATRQTYTGPTARHERGNTEAGKPCNRVSRGPRYDNEKGSVYYLVVAHAAGRQVAAVLALHAVHQPRRGVGRQL